MAKKKSAKAREKRIAVTASKISKWSEDIDLSALGGYELLKQLYEINSYSNEEGEMRQFILQYIRDCNIDCTMKVDAMGNILITKGDSETYPCMCSHIDEVHKRGYEKIRIVCVDNVIFGYNTRNGHTMGIGGDDKNGIWCCLTALRTETVPLKVAFFVGEEIGCVGSSSVDTSFFEDCRFIIQIDRKGSGDFISVASGTKLCDKDFIKAANLDKFGYKETSGLMTDVMELKEQGVMCAMCNVSCGYYNPHTDDEFTRIDEINNAYNFVSNIINTVQDVYECKYVYKPTFFGSYPRYGEYAKCGTTFKSAYTDVHDDKKGKVDDTTYKDEDDKDFYESYTAKDEITNVLWDMAEANGYDYLIEHEDEIADMIVDASYDFSFLKEKNVAVSLSEAKDYINDCLTFYGVY